MSMSQLDSFSEKCKIQYLAFHQRKKTCSLSSKFIQDNETTRNDERKRSDRG